MKHSFDLDHTKRLQSGECAACVFLRRAIELQRNLEYRKQFEEQLARAVELHNQPLQAELFGKGV